MTVIAVIGASGKLGGAPVTLEAFLHQEFRDH
jgi:hypothetical protein